MSRYSYIFAVYLSLSGSGAGAGARCVLYVNGQRSLEMGAHHTSTRQPISHYIKLSYYCGRFFGLNDVGCIDMNQMRTNERRSDD